MLAYFLGLCVFCNLMKLRLLNVQYLSNRLGIHRGVSNLKVSCQGDIKISCSFQHKIMNELNLRFTSIFTPPFSALSGCKLKCIHSVICIVSQYSPVPLYGLAKLPNVIQSLFGRVTKFRYSSNRDKSLETEFCDCSTSSQSISITTGD